MFRFPKNRPQTHEELIYCRHDNRMVAHCPRGIVMADCPLRHECPADQPELRTEAASS